jgi:hypothetical protein
VKLAVDHCHTTDAIRGLLCSDCNNGLGRFRDDPEKKKLLPASYSIKTRAAPLPEQDASIYFGEGAIRPNILRAK